MGTRHLDDLQLSCLSNASFTRCVLSARTNLSAHASSRVWFGFKMAGNNVLFPDLELLFVSVSTGRLLILSYYTYHYIRASKRKNAELRPG